MVMENYKKQNYLKNTTRRPLQTEEDKENNSISIP